MSANTKEALNKVLMFIFLGFLIWLAVSSSIQYTQATYNEAKNTAPTDYYSQQWELAMSWVNENTPVNSIFVHWWDYGYWVQTLGGRPTVTDGGHVNALWDHYTARYILTARNETTALQACKAYNVSYLLIDSSDLAKYPAYASIGSDKSGTDRLSSVGFFNYNDKSMLERRNDTFIVYDGQWMLDEDIIWNNKIYPRQKSAVVRVSLTINKENNITLATSLIYYNGATTEVPLKHVYVNGKMYNFEDGADNLFYIIPSLNDNGLNPIGAGLYLGEKSMNSEVARLYLFEYSNNFIPVHKEENRIISSLNYQYNLSFGDFLMYGNYFMGPIKIYEVNYPQEIQYHNEYLEIAYPGENDWGKLDNLGI